MSKTLYLECQAGISGDMTVAALLDLGADENVLREALQSLPVDGYEIRISQVTKAGIVAKDFDVILDAEHEGHDHDMEYLHGHAYKHQHEQNHHHQHDHEHGHHHSHEHRSMADILEILHKAKLTVRARDTALRIFDILAQAEAKAHGTTVEQVHFHEVGAVDSIVDIVATAVCLDNLDITQVIVPKLSEGSGSVRCQHGVLPVPVPAVANIVSTYGICLEIMPLQGEFVTPTGAAIVAAVRTSEELPEKMKIERIGIGAGKRTYERPSLLRAMLIQNAQEKEDCIFKLESNIADTTGEALGYLM
ncbi:MAG: LarC family nickel insertion protein, partial [Wujia sp.]